MSAVPNTTVEFTRLRDTDHWSVEAAIDEKLMKLVRKAEPMGSIGDVNRSFDEIQDVISKFPVRSWGLVFDMREARPAQSPEIEDAFRENRKRIYGAFRRQAVLLQTAAGVMQVRRMLQQAPDPKIGVFSDADEALDWARAPG